MVAIVTIRSMDTIKAIRVKSLSTKFRSTTALTDVSFEVAKGNVFGILGPNGAGKTTTISIILSLQNPDSGTVEVLGEKVDASRNKILRSVGALIGDGPAFY